MTFLMPEQDSVVLPRDSATAVALAGAAPASVVATVNNETPVVVTPPASSAAVVTMAIPGPRGPAGAQGEAGKGLVILGVLASEADLPPAAAVGDAYLIGTDVWLFSGATWVNAGNIRGPAGKDGQIRFTGNGAPPTVIVGAAPGDTYMDLLTGDIYKLE